MALPTVPATPAAAESGHAGTVALLWLDAAASPSRPHPNFWRIAASLSEAWLQLGRVPREEIESPRGQRPLRISALDAETGSERDGSVAGLREGVRAVVLVTAEIAEWHSTEAELADGFAARVAVAADRPVAWVEADAGEQNLRPGLIVVPRRLVVGDEGTPRERGAWARTALDLRVVRRLRELDVSLAALCEAVAATDEPSIALRADEGHETKIVVDEAAIGVDRENAGSVHVRVGGWLAARPPIRTVVVRVGPRRYFVRVDGDRADVAAALPWVVDTRCGFVFEHRAEGLPAGKHGVTIERVDGRLLFELGRVKLADPATAEGADSASETTAPAAPAVTVERAVLAWTGVRPRLRVEGAVVEVGNGIDCVRVRYDGRVVFDADPAGVLSAEGGGSRLRLLFDEEIDAEKEIAAVGIELLRRQGVVASWQGNPTVERTEAGPLRLVSPAFDRLRRASPVDLWGDLVIDGVVAGADEHSVASLEVTGSELAATPLGHGGAFELHAEIPQAGEQTAAVVVRRRGVEVLRSPTVVVRSRRVSAPPSWAERIRRILAAIEPFADGWSAVPATDLAERLVRRFPETQTEIDIALEDLAGALTRSVDQPGVIVGELPPPPEWPLNVLFATWEIPWLGHGGGQAMINLFRTLGRRHSITLLHPVHPGAEELSEVARHYVDAILTVPRGWHEESRFAPYGTPTGYRRTFSDALRVAVAAEAASGRYDLINLEFEGMALHAPQRSQRPTIGVLIEPLSFARLIELGPASASLDEAAVGFERTLRGLAFDIGVVARRFQHLVTLTEPEADLLARFLPGREIVVNPIAIDVERLAKGAARAAPVARPTFVYVGTFRHPPNRAAVIELIDTVVPELRRRLPEARVVVGGADPPPALVDRAAGAGVEMLGWIDDLPALLASATAFLAPIRTGAGMRVKLLEAMACGCPVVSTALGMSGIAARPGEDFLLAESARDFVAAAVRLAGSRDLRSSLAEAGPRLVERDHGLEVQGDRRQRIWARALRAGGGAGVR